MSSNSSREVVEAVATRVADAPVAIDTGTPRTDGKTIWLPFNQEEFNFDDMIGLASHEGSHIRFKSSMNPDLLKSLCSASPKLAAGVLNIFEDFRVNFLLREIYPGFWESLDDLSYRIIKKKIQTLLTSSDYGLEYIVETASIFAYVDPRWNEADKKSIELIGSKISFWNEIKGDFSYVRKFRTMASSIISARRFLERLASEIKEESKMAKEFLKMLEEALKDVEGMKGKAGQVLKNLEKIVEGLGKGVAIDSKIDKEIEGKMKEESEQLEKELDQMKLTGTNPPRDAVHKDVDGDITVQVFDTKDKLKVENRVTNPRSAYIKIVEKNRYTINELKRSLDSIRQGQDTIRGLKSGQISSRDLSKVISSKGKFDRPFHSMQKQRGAKVLIVIDESGSMTSSFGTRGSIPKIDIAKESAIILSEALSGTRIKFGVVGFSAVYGHPMITEKIYKKFEENPDPEKIGTIGSSNNSSENRDGTSLELIAKKFFNSTMGDVPIMIVISDGDPHHGGTALVGKEGMDDAIIKVRKIRQAIKVFVLSFDLCAKRYISDIYGPNHAILKDDSDLKTQLLFLVRTISKSL